MFIIYNIIYHTLIHMVWCFNMFQHQPFSSLSPAGSLTCPIDALLNRQRVPAVFKAQNVPDLILANENEIPSLG